MNHPVPAALIVACLLAPGASHGQDMSIDDMRETCLKEPYACALGEHVLERIGPCQTLPKQAEGQPADFTMVVRLTLDNGKPVGVRISTPNPEATPFEKQMAEGYQAAIEACQPYGPVSGTAIFWIQTDVQRAPAP